ncbi:ABC transporter ATP-binding protein [Nitratireductor sp. XY-223]|uniref:ABC transporter ATP-binding protein n=1 Tax=Nitratireductor sp. XY-223 TaxID=2561926 RepID=UPI0010AA0E86|nr:ABC transporter ATP-binding protein [Nitratireductor sp. XY-223]
MVVRRLFSLFERWIDPFANQRWPQPGSGAVGFLWQFVRQAKWPFVAMLALGGAVALLEVALFYFVGRLVDLLESADPQAGWQGLSDQHGPELVFMLLVVLVGRFVVAPLVTLVEEQTVVPGFFNLVRWQAYSRISRQSLSFFQDDFAGRVVAKVWQSGQAVGDFMVSLLQVVWFIAIYAVTTLVLVAQLDWRLAAVVALWIAAFAVVARHFVPRIRHMSKTTAEAASMLNGRLVDSYSNIQTLKLFGREDENDRYIKEGFDQFIAAVIPFTRNLTGVRVSLAVLSGIMICTIAYISIDLWLRGQISVGAVAFTLSLVLRLSLLLGRMMTQLNGLMRNYGTIQNSMEMLNKPILLRDRPDAGELQVTQSRIHFENVCFRYSGRSAVIDDVSLTVEPGQKVGLVGLSGAGKSTLVNLLLRFFDLESGRITIDGQDIAAVTQSSLRAQISVVTQDTSLMHRSVRDNIVLGRIGAQEQDIVRAAERAEAWHFIKDLRDQHGRTGLDAHVGERGVKLSGGQRQRIAIARVMLKNAPILVLDEATSALDSEIEAAIQENLTKLMEGKTVIAIAHRLSTIARMNRLIVMHDGRIVEDGSHHELLERNGLYARLWARQSGGFISNSMVAQR